MRRCYLEEAVISLKGYGVPCLRCDPKTFELFDKEGWVTPGPDEEEFLYEALGSMVYTGMTPIDLSGLSPDVSRDWDRLEEWCDGVRHSLFGRLTNEVGNDFEDVKEILSPIQVFGSLASLKTKLIELICADSESENLICVELRCGRNRRFLIYFDPDSWALGHGTSVLVVKSLRALNKRSGYYPLRRDPIIS